ncbi:MAG: DeoR/GlpR transcriptional regulator [Clostridia bacterium]|nr:DeoR/GlpR transcriptional regulator [Clostridia bacterium]
MKKDRIEEVAILLDKRGKLTLEQLCANFPDVSEMTLRRDLLKLEKDNRIIRIRGGAMSVKEVKKVSGEEYTKKTVIHTDEKREIAQKASELIEEGCCFFLDGGTTALYFAKEMPDIPCTVFTNGIAVAMELAQKKNLKITLLGGELLKENLSTASPVGMDYFRRYNFNFAMISASAFTVEKGFSCSSQIEADLLKAVREKAEAVYMLLDSSKIGKVNPYTFAYIEDLDVLITDDVFPDSIKQEFKKKNIVVM